MRITSVIPPSRGTMLSALTMLVPLSPLVPKRTTANCADASGVLSLFSLHASGYTAGRDRVCLSRGV